MGRYHRERKTKCGTAAPDARQLYQSGTAKQLRDRMSGKQGKLMAQENIADADIREAVLRVKELERRLVRRPPAADVAPAPPQDIRDNVAAQMSDLSDEEPDDARADNQPPVLPQAGMNEQPAQRIKKRPLADIIRENQLEYNKFIKKKIPKLMRQLGVSSDDSDSN
ncbi:uncharacterized protein LOC123545357 [Mercenaria mercenaria]|uniref:uncharacterized protein LOC123545357 n=1 Tax=Mercenaria mercenaria TaxID=6596 RepID=UPI001E1D5AAF|nr:uncharacterized protein LOC123545357 [Mercenaria mercenaria]